MAKLIYSAFTSLDGYVADETGNSIGRSWMTKSTPSLEEGFVVDYAAGGNRKVAEWVQGEPKGSFWHGVDLSSASQIPIVTYRCAACGYLEFYALGKELGLIP